MAKICKPFSLFVAAAALALISVAAQEDTGLERVNLDANVLGAVSVASDDLVGNEAVADPVEEAAVVPSEEVTEEVRSTDDLAQSASEAAIPVEEEVRSAEEAAEPAVEERSADALAQSANNEAAPEERSADETTADAASAEDVASDADLLLTATAPADDDSSSGDATILTAEAAGSATNEALIIGGNPNVLSSWLDLVIDNNAVTVLVDALTKPTNYDPTIKSPVCVLQINSGTIQTVSGTNYRYQVLGCPIAFADELGACRNRACASAMYEVTVYQQTWNNILQVSSIQESQ